MSEVRLENITKTYTGGSRWASTPGISRRAYTDYQDKAFVDRVAGRSVAVGQSAGPVRALDGLNLTIRDGEAVAVVGPSGCGKSTLLRVVAGLETQDEGKVYYDDEMVNDLAPKDRGIGMVFQSYALYPHMKGEGNLRFFFRVRQRPPEEMMERIRITSEIMGIGFDRLLESKPGALSGGQQQRVAIGRCIVRDPKLFLFDEPLSNLDAKLRVSTRIEIKRLLQRFQITAIYVTHDQTEAMTMGDRIAVMRRGKIEQIGTYQQITENPINSFVAGFLGLTPMNLLGGWRASEGAELESELGRMPVPLRLATEIIAGQKVIVGFRSEDARLIVEPDSPTTSGLVMRARVINSEPNFARHYQLVNVEAKTTIFGVQAPIDTPINSGWDVQVVVPDESVYLFDESTEARILPNM